MSTCPDLETLMNDGDTGAHLAECSACRAVVALAHEHQIVSRPGEPIACARVDALLAGRLLGGVTARQDKLLGDHILGCASCLALAREVDHPGVADAVFEMGAVPFDDFAELRTVDLDNYTRGTEIGRGGMGRIVRARDRRLGRAVAIKELLDDKLRARFEREARLTARLQHPAIVNVHEAGCWPSGAPFYVMKYVAGEPLDRLIAAPRTLAERLAYLANVTAVVEAIAYAHSERVIHRDLKPANILVGPFGETVVIDWGLAKDLAETNPEPGSEPPYRDATPLTIGGIGTPAYMPPEQATGQMDDPRVDVYALGATLYHLVAGQPPFGGGVSADQVLDRLRREGPPPIAELEPATPPELAAIIGKAIARDPRARYATASELAEELRRYQTGQLIGAHRYTLAELWARWLRRHRAPVGVAAIFVALLATVGAVSVSRVVAARGVAEHQLGELLVERGEKELIAGYPSRALVYFVAALQRGIDTPALRFATAQASRPAQALVSSIQVDRPPVAAAVSPDGERMVLAAAKGPVEVREVRGGRILHDLGPLTEGTNVVAYSPDGKLILTASIDQYHSNDVYLWDAESGARKLALPRLGWVAQVSFNADGTRLLTIDEKAVTAWDSEGKKLGAVPFDFRAVNWPAFSPDGRRVAIFGDDLRGRVYDVDTGRLLATLEAAHPAGLKYRRLSRWHNPQRAVAFDAGGDQIFVGVWRGETDIFDVATGALSKTLNTGDDGEGPIAARFSADGERLLTWDEQSEAHLWYPRRSSPLHSEHTLPQSAAVTDGWFIGDDVIVVVGGDGVVRLWGKLGQEGDVLDLHRSSLVTARVLEDPRRAVTIGADGSVKAWALAAPYFALKEGARQPLFDDRGRLLTLDSPIASVWDVTTGAELARTELKTSSCLYGAFARDGRTVLVECDEGLKTWDLASGAIADEPSHRSAPVWLTSGGMSRDGERRLKWTDGANIVDRSGTQIAHLSGNQLTLSPRGTLVVGFEGQAEDVAVWDFRTGEKLHSLAVDHEPALLGAHIDGGDGGDIVVSENDDRIVVGVKHILTPRRQVSVWDMHGKHIADIASSTPISHLAMSANGGLILTFDTGTHATVWSGNAGTEVCVLDSPSDPIQAGAFTPDAAMIVTGTLGGHVKVWDAATCQLLASLGAPGRDARGVGISPDGHRAFVSTDEGGALWDLHGEPRDLTSDARLAERVPLRLDGVRLEPRKLAEPHAEPSRVSYQGYEYQIVARVLMDEGRNRAAAEAMLAAYDATRSPRYLLSAGVAYGYGRFKPEAIGALTRYLATNPVESRPSVEQMIARLRDPEHVGLDGVTSPGKVDEIFASGRLGEAESECALAIVIFGSLAAPRQYGPQPDNLLLTKIDRFIEAHEPIRAARLLRLLIEVVPPGDVRRMEAARRLGALAPPPR